MFNRMIELLKKIEENFDNIYNSAIIIIQIGFISGACHHLLRGDGATAIIFAVLALLFTGLYSDYSD